MLLHRIRGLWNTYHGILAIIFSLVFWSYLLVLARLFKDIGTDNFEKLTLYNLAGIVGLIIAAIFGRSAAATLVAGGFVESHTLAFKQTVYVGVTILIVFVASAMDPTVLRFVSLSVFFGFLIVLYTVFLLCHLLVPRRLADHLFSSEGHEERTLLIGPVEKAREIGNWIEKTAAFGFGMRGSVPDDAGEEERILHVPRVFDVAMLERIIKNEGIGQILLLEIPLNPEGLELIVNTANKAGVRLLVVNNLEEIFKHDITLYNLHNKSFISLRDEPLNDPVSRILKRTMDLMICLPVLIFVLSPLCLIVKIFQTIQAPGPLFHRETRGGLRNRPFRVFNFRTVRIPKSASANEPAIEEFYPFGSWLRQTGLAQVPQVLNVFSGDMSVVGPQPRRVIHNRRFSEIMDKYHVRTFVKPGMTGLAQIYGFAREVKSDMDVVEGVKLDIHYIENWSLPLDFWIILKAIVQLVKPPMVG